MESTLHIIQTIRTYEEAKALLYRTISHSLAIDEALQLALNAHEGQFRKSGEAYVVHPVLVACLVASISEEESMVIAAILHDVVEDTPVTLEAIATRFSDDVVHLVDGLTKIDEIRDQKLIGSQESGHLTKSALSFRKILIASTKDIRVLVVKLCDRMHNMLTLDALPLNKQRRIAEETMVVYAPIAHRLGVSSLKRTLEDWSFRYLFPHEYKTIDDYLSHHNQDFSQLLNTFIKKIETLMLQNGFEEAHFKIVGRVKHYYSTYLKLQRKGISIEEVLDLLAIRILVKEPIDCYKVIGLVHLHFKPLMARFKDYVCVPKENGYQTIHTTVFDNRSIFEVQVRTFVMHQTAELGVAAHWKYKTGGHSINLEWLSNLSNQESSVEAFMDLAKKDLFSEDITVYSPMGDSFTLPREAVALDFAYAIHTSVGDHAVGATINKQRVSLLSELKNGDLVQIETGQEVKIRCTWMDAVKTSKARHALAHNCNLRNKEINLMSAVNIVKEILNVKPPILRAWVEQSECVKTFQKAAFEPAYLNYVIATYYKEVGKSSRFSVFSSLQRFKLRQYTIGYLHFYSNNSVNDVAFNHCCHPKKGDEIVAFKKGSMALVHHKMCEVAQHLIEAQAPMVLVLWNSDRVYRYHLIVSLVNSKGALAKFLQFLAKIDLDILSIELGTKQVDEMQHCTLSFETKQPDISWLRVRIDKQAHVIDFVRADDIYQK